MSTYQSLLQQKAELDAQIAEVQRIQRSQAVAVARTLILQYGLTFNDVFGPKAMLIKVHRCRFSNVIRR